MHLANLRYSLSNCACPAGVAGDTAALTDAAAEDELAVATVFELPHAAVSTTSPADATIAAARKM
jgi:hypothetical protein